MRSFRFTLVALFLLCSRLCFAYNFLHIQPKTGVPIGWEPGTTITYYVDPGDFGRLTNAQALALVQEAMKIWESASLNASVPHFEFGGFLPEDINETNYQDYVSLEACYEDDLASCPTQAQKDLKTVIIFDDNANSILNNVLCKITPCAASSGARVFGGSLSNPTFIKQGVVVFGGSLAVEKITKVVGTMTHELGHLLGLAHTVVNQEVPIKNEWEKYAADIPTMMSVYFPSSGESLPTLNPDDVAGISMLYPSGSFVADTATIKGKVLKSDGMSMSHVNVIVRNIEDPLCEAFSLMTDRTCTASNTACGSDGTGAYEINGLPAGSYTLEVEEVADKSLAATLVPGLVNPFIDGDAEFWNDGDAAGDPSNLTSSTITLAPGETRENVDIILDRSEVTADRIKFIPSDTFTPGPGTRCPEKPLVDYAAMIGIDETPASPLPSGSSGGCNLLQR